MRNISDRYNIQGVSDLRA